MTRALIALAAALLATGCADPGTASSDVLGDWHLAGGSVDGGPLPQPAGRSATLTLGPEEVSGASFCNHYSSTYRLDGTTLAIDGLGGTAMGCEPDAMAAETAYLDALGRARTATMDGEDLLLSSDGVELRFTPVAPVQDSPLEGTRWVLETVVEDLTASSTVGDPAVLTLDADRRAEASTGCGTITGTWVVEDDSLVIDDLLGNAAMCPPDRERQDAHVQAVLRSGPTLEIDEDRLTLTADDGRGLVYRAGD